MIDSLLFGGVRFVLDKIALTVDRELNDEEHLRQALLDLEMRLELGEITPADAAREERDILARLRAVRADREEGLQPSDGAVSVTGAEVSLAEELDEAPAPPKPKRRR